MRNGDSSEELSCDLPLILQCHAADHNWSSEFGRADLDKELFPGIGEQLFELGENGAVFRASAAGDAKEYIPGSGSLRRLFSVEGAENRIAYSRRQLISEEL